MAKNPKIKVAVIGLGNAGKAAAEYIYENSNVGTVVLADRDAEKSKGIVHELDPNSPDYKEGVYVDYNKDGLEEVSQRLYEKWKSHSREDAKRAIEYAAFYKSLAKEGELRDSDVIVTALGSMTDASFELLDDKRAYEILEAQKKVLQGMKSHLAWLMKLDEEELEKKVRAQFCSTFSTLIQEAEKEGFDKSGLMQNDLDQISARLLYAWSRYSKGRIMPLPGNDFNKISGTALQEYNQKHKSDETPGIKEANDELEKRLEENPEKSYEFRIYRAIRNMDDERVHYRAIRFFPAAIIPALRLGKALSQNQNGIILNMSNHTEYVGKIIASFAGKKFKDRVINVAKYEGMRLDSIMRRMLKSLNLKVPVSKEIQGEHSFLYVAGKIRFQLNASYTTDQLEMFKKAEEEINRYSDKIKFLLENYPDTMRLLGKSIAKIAGKATNLTIDEIAELRTENAGNSINVKLSEIPEFKAAVKKQLKDEGYEDEKGEAVDKEGFVILRYDFDKKEGRTSVKASEGQEICAKIEPEDGGQLPKSALDLAQIYVFQQKLFDAIGNIEGGYHEPDGSIKSFKLNHTDYDTYVNAGNLYCMGIDGSIKEFEIRSDNVENGILKHTRKVQLDGLSKIFSCEGEIIAEYSVGSCALNSDLKPSEPRPDAEQTAPNLEESWETAEGRIRITGDKYKSKIKLEKTNENGKSSENVKEVKELTLKSNEYLYGLKKSKNYLVVSVGRGDGFFLKIYDPENLKFIDEFEVGSSNLMKSHIILQGRYRK
ncbi:hypothetical protein KY311_03600 [Candidatus Woesearchaeota archaeon]|nr:hypothetical protein [Candidatus Woesearchaeota archaeon]